MASPHVEKRLTELEELHAALVRAQLNTQSELDLLSRAQLNTQSELDLLSREMREFKAEMREFKDEMGAFKDEMGEFKTEMRKSYGELVNQLGTMAEDLVAPSVPRILREVVGCREEEMAFSGVRVRKPHAERRGLQREFDVVAVCGAYALIAETKTRLRPEDVDGTLSMLADIRSFFPEYREKRFLCAVATLYPDPSVVAYGEKSGLLVLGFGAYVMEVRNAPGFKPREF